MNRTNKFTEGLEITRDFNGPFIRLRPRHFYPYISKTDQLHERQVSPGKYLSSIVEERFS